jgi:hypothetical protein
VLSGPTSEIKREIMYTIKSNTAISSLLLLATFPWNRRQRLVELGAVTKNAKFTPRFRRRRSIRDENLCFRWEREVIESFECLGEFEKDFQKCWIYCVWYLLMTELCKKKLKTNYEISCKSTFKGIVQRKLTEVASDINRKVSFRIETLIFLV